MTEPAAVQELIYGCMGLGGSWSTEPYSSRDVDEAAAAVEAALDTGITLFDHADIYRSGKSEAVFGEVLAGTPGLRERIRLQTKCGIRLNEQGLETHYDLSRDAILERVNESLDRLRTDYVDVLLLHRPDPLMDPAEVASAVGQLMAEGKVRALGVSNMSGAADRVPAGPAGDARWWPTSWNEPAQARLAGEHRAGQPCRGHGLQLSARHRWSTAPGTGSPCRPTARWPAASTPGRRPNGPTPAEEATAALVARAGTGQGHHRGGRSCWAG